MKIIAHRGNVNGPNPQNENLPIYLEEAIANGFDVETDVWFIDNSLFLGHDKPDHEIELDFLLKYSGHLWIHCKNMEAINYLVDFNELNIFWHENDTYTLTSKNYIWSSPKSQSTKKTVVVMPEWFNFEFNRSNCFGVCTDYALKICYHQNETD